MSVPRWLVSDGKPVDVSLLVSPLVKQDPVVGGKPPRSPILSRRFYQSSVRGRRVGGHVFVQWCSLCTLSSVLQRVELFPKRNISHTVYHRERSKQITDICLFIQTSHEGLVSLPPPAEISPGCASQRRRPVSCRHHSRSRTGHVDEPW